MAKLVIGKRSNWLTVFCFQLCIVANNLFGTDEKLYMISKLATLLFFGVVTLRILYKGKVQFNQILLLPILFIVYCTATILWAYSPSAALSKMTTQVQLLLLLVFTFWSMNDGVTVLDYLKAVYASGFGMVIFAMARYGGVSQYTDAMISGERMGEEITNLNTFGMVFGNAALAAAYYMVLKGKKIHIFPFVLFSFFALSSASRKAMLMVVVGVVALAVFHYGLRRIYKTLIIGAVVTVAAVYVLQLPYFGEIGERIQNLISGEKDASDIERQRMVEFGLRLFREKPIHGYGIGNYASMYHISTYSHNNYIELMVSGGVIALVLYYLMLLIPSVGLLLSRKKGDALDDLHLMLWVWVAVEVVFSVAMVQVYNKNSWLLMGVLMAEAVHATYRKNTLQENRYEGNA